VAPQRHKLQADKPKHSSSMGRRCGSTGEDETREHQACGGCLGGSKMVEI
jgi:hypothetical protein